MAVNFCNTYPTKIARSTKQAETIDGKKLIAQKPPDLEWDECKIGKEEAAYRIQEAKNEEDLKEYLGMDEDQAFAKVMQDSDVFDLRWDDLCEMLTELMRKIQARAYCSSYWLWIAKVTGFGWRNLNGSTHFRADNGSTLLQKVLPKTDCTFKIWVDRTKREFWIQNFHHDSPTGNEWYRIHPALKNDVEEIGLEGFRG